MSDRNLLTAVYDLKQYQKLSLEHDDNLREMMLDIAQMQNDTNRMLAILLHCLVDADIMPKGVDND